MNELQYKRSFVKRLQNLSTTNQYGCWLIHNSIDKNTGYYIASYHNKSVRGHRKIYELFFDDLKENMVIDHLCQNKNCVNPEHLEQVTIGENSRRGIRYLPPTHCKRGHEFTPENTYIQAKTGFRYCIICRRERDKKRKPRRKLWQQNNRDKMREYSRKYKEKNYEEVKRKDRIRHAEARQKLK